MNSSLEANGRGIYITHSPNCTITRCSILGNETGIFLLYSDACKLINNICSFNAVGVHLYDSSNCSITNNRVSDNGVGIALNYLSKDNTVQFNEIHGNTWSGMNSLALNNDYPINASNNWWGHDSGPYHADNNPGGRGDNVSDGVDFAPWTRKGEGETEERRPLVYLAVVLIVLVLAALLRFLIVHLKRRKPVLAHKCENNTLGRRGTGW